MATNGEDRHNNGDNNKKISSLRKFALAIYEDTDRGSYRLQAKNDGVPDAQILLMVKHVKKKAKENMFPQD